MAPTQTSGPRVLFFDIESSPNTSYTWGIHEQEVIRVVKERQVISFAWKWLGEKRVRCLALPDFPGYKKNPDDNGALIRKLHDVMSEADIVVAHNGIDFDIKYANTEFIKHGLDPAPPSRAVDTLLVAKRYFRFNSNKLDELGKVLGVGRKVKHTGFDLWLGCMRGDVRCWRMMRKYNAQDVALLERVYLRLRPFMQAHPNMTVTDGKEGCPHCRSKGLTRRGWTISNSGKRPRFQCRDCGKWSVGKFQSKQGAWRFQ